jgi:hypothetical protein
LHLAGNGAYNPAVRLVTSSASLVACDDDSVTVSADYEGVLGIGHLLLGTFYDPTAGKPLDSCNILARRVINTQLTSLGLKLTTTQANATEIFTEIDTVLMAVGSARHRRHLRQEESGYGPRLPLSKGLADWKSSLGVGVTVSPTFSGDFEIEKYHVCWGFSCSDVGAWFQAKLRLSYGVKVDVFVPAGTSIEAINGESLVASVTKVHSLGRLLTMHIPILGGFIAA